MRISKLRGERRIWIEFSVRDDIIVDISRGSVDIMYVSIFDNMSQLSFGKTSGGFVGSLNAVGA